MQSPFRIFRKHQKGVMVVLVFTAVILFTVGDSVLKMASGTGGPQGSKVVVETNIGKLTQLQMHNLMQQRKIVNRFIQTAYARSHPEMEKSPFFNQMLPYILQRFGFGSISERDIFYTWLYRHEARKLGIVVSDKQVEDYIDSFTDRKLSTKKFQEILRDMQIGPKELFDFLRDELQAVTAFRMKQPVVVASPEKYWEYYQELNTRQKIEVVELPVNDFTGQVPEPTDAQITKLFEKHKDEVERRFGILDPFDGEFKPGFRQPRRVKLQYLELAFADIEAKSRTAGPVTEKEVEEYYESRKALDTRFQEGETGLNDDASPLDPGFAPENGEKMPPDETDSDADSTDQKEKPGQPDEESPKPPADEPKSKASQPGEKPQGEKPEDKPDCSSGVDDADKEDAAPTAEADKPAAKPRTDTASAKDAAGAKEPGPTETPEKASKDTDAKEKEDSKEDDTAPQGPILSPGKARQHEIPKIKYKPLDDDLREKIRESIIQERAKKMMKDQVANAREAMSKVAAGFAVSTEVKLTDPNAKQLAELERRAKDELREIADKFNMKFGETDLVSEHELADLPGLGKAVEPGSFDPARGDSTSIVEQAFTGDALCRAFESETLDSNIYLCWKVADVAMHVPELKEPGVREQVIAAWKRLEAMPLAEKRAKELAQLARTKEKNFEEALAGETVTGDPQGSALAVAESKEFSFWREPAAPNPFTRSRQQPVQLDDPGVVKKPGRKFMHAVFDTLGEGDVGVALNGDASIYYVVKVISRRPAEREAFKDVQLFAQNSPYAYLAQNDQQLVLFENSQRIAIKWHDLPGREQGQMTPDDE
jgi:hypothetical protein